MKKKPTKKKMSKQQNSYSENFVRRLRHSHKTQFLSLAVATTGLIGIFLVVGSLAPAQFGENVDNQTIARRGDSFTSKAALRFSDTYNRINFLTTNKKNNPEWIQPTNLPAPPEEVKLALPDSSRFGDVNTQSVVAEESDAPDQANQSEETATPRTQPPVPEQSPPAGSNKTPTAQIPTVDNSELGLGSSCPYEKEAAEA